MTVNMRMMSMTVNMDVVKRDIIEELERCQKRTFFKSHKNTYTNNIAEVRESEDLLELAHGMLEDVDSALSAVLEMDEPDKRDMGDTVPDVVTAKTIIWALWNEKERRRVRKNEKVRGTKGYQQSH